MGQEISVNYVVEKLRGKGKDLGGENWMNYVVEKLREKERDLGVGNWMNYVVKSKEWLVVLENFGTSSIGKVVDRLQVTLSIPTCLGSIKVHLLSILRPYVPWVSTIGAAILLLFILYNLRGGGGGGGKAAVRMMKAPGRSYRIPRPGFEANPRLYFRGLRGKPV